MASARVRTVLWGEGFSVPLLYMRLFQRYGHRFWWPGDTPFEIAVGAVLVQNVQWRRVEHLFQEHPGLKDPQYVQRIPEARLAQWLRPVGSSLRKARAIQALARKFPTLTTLSDEEARRMLLAIHGVGPETADSVLLYALNRPVFVVDAYTRRILARVWDQEALLRIPYDTLRRWLEARIPRDVAWYQDAHAQFVVHAQRVCRVRPRCEACVLRSVCMSGSTG